DHERSRTLVEHAESLGLVPLADRHATSPLGVAVVLSIMRIATAAAVRSIRSLPRRLPVNRRRDVMFLPHDVCQHQRIMGAWFPPMLARGPGVVNARCTIWRRSRLARLMGFEYDWVVGLERRSVSSQRVREDRILEKLRLGTLPSATQLTTPEAVRAAIGSKPTGEGRCHGCDELQADAFVADHAWHYLCFLFWQGRNEVVRQTHPADPKTDGAHKGIVPKRARWVVVVKVNRPEAFTALRRNFAKSAWVEVVIDRRRGERRRAAAGTSVERRVAGRRIADRAQIPGF